MTKLTAALIAAAFAAATVTPAFAADKADKAKKPTAEECQKDSKLPGCESMEKAKKK